MRIRYSNIPCKLTTHPYLVMLTLVLMLWTGSSCQHQANEHQVETDDRTISRAMERTNVLLIDAERQEIDDFIHRYGWDMNETGTGLRYSIYEHGTGASAESGKIARIHYKVFLLNGDLIYTSEQEGEKYFRIGQGGVESGLEEGILLLRKGDKARFIIPSHLAHGVTGDGARIPQRASIIYELELIDLI
jgi:FKBP-type peptidyl-prolyl cis-trans isomerase FkpA